MPVARCFECDPVPAAHFSNCACLPHRYKKEIDVTPSLDYGLVAEEVAAVDPNLVACNKAGQIETVRYTAVNAMLLNEFLKEHRKNEDQQATIAQLKSTDAKQEAIIARQQKQIEALTAGLQKVSVTARTEQARTANGSEQSVKLRSHNLDC